MSDILIFGGLLLDRYFLVDKLPEPSKDGFILDSFHMAGGCAINMAKTVQNLGGKGYVTSYIGKDAWGQEICKYMEEQKLPLHCVKETEEETGYCLVFLESDGERTFLTAKGIEGYFSVKLVPEEVEKNCNVAAITGYYLLDETSEELVYYLRKLKEMGYKIILDPSPLVENIDGKILEAVVLAVYQSRVSVYGTTVAIPFINKFVDFGIWYVPFIAFVVVAMVNSVNLTDGLDGLAAGVTLIIAVFFSFIGMLYGFTTPSLFCAALGGACLGFLMFNKHPAKVFMGDTGSLALGGGIAAAAIMMNIELILPIAGGIYVIEAISVILQVVSFKLRGKRIFKMSPIHHHFELSGWKETKVVVVFWTVTFILCVISLLIV
jgi:hypothetical protein